MGGVKFTKKLQGALMKKIFLVCLMCCSSMAFSQEKKTDKIPQVEETSGEDELYLRRCECCLSSAVHYAFTNNLDADFRAHSVTPARKRGLEIMSYYDTNDIPKKFGNAELLASPGGLACVVFWDKRVDGERIEKENKNKCKKWANDNIKEARKDLQACLTDVSSRFPGGFLIQSFNRFSESKKYYEKTYKNIDSNFPFDKHILCWEGQGTPSYKEKL